MRVEAYILKQRSYLKNIEAIAIYAGAYSVPPRDKESVLDRMVAWLPQGIKLA